MLWRWVRENDMLMVSPSLMANKVKSSMGITTLMLPLSLLFAVSRSSSSLHRICKSAPNCLSWPTILEKLEEARENSAW